MTERGLPIVDGAPACPFVAFEDDRDERATSPDHRHRCYAEIRPAPRALAHQEAYCLSSAFPVCPTFQDWARREAARARRDEPGAVDAASVAAAAAESGGRNAPRDWTAPPPWAPDASGAEDRRDLRDGERDDVDEDDAEVVPVPARGGGLSGSFADRMLGRTPADDRPADREDVGPAAAVVPPIAATPREAARPIPTADEDVDDDGYDDDRDEDRPTRGRRPVGARPRRELEAPAWERPRRLEAYPTIRERRMPGSSIGGQPVILGAIAILIAAVALFFLPSLLPIGSPGATATPSPGSTSGASAAASGAGVATPTPGPTAHVYVVQAGDTMSRIAARFGVPLQTLIDANKDTIPNPDALQIGDKVTIPAPAATTIPNAFTPAPSK